MGYTVEFEDDDLRCRSRADAEAAAAIIQANSWMHPYHLTVTPLCSSFPEDDADWLLEVMHAQGDHWNSDEANKVWLALAPHLADGATIEFQGEGLERWRVRWHSGHVYEEYVHEVTWRTAHEILPPEKEKCHAPHDPPRGVGRHQG